ncbi:MAG TPA: polyphosphate polymerase domain-containing protein [Eubacteriales bacterium]|nr:polyphosphate polymerase domain-containing protein [Eubacteriales bacterium]
MLQYRCEQKFVCTQAQLIILKTRIKAVMRTDSHQPGECYRVRSLYFDDEDGSAFYDNDAGTDHRRKFRLRVYDHPEARISLEIKYKKHGDTHKEACIVSKEFCERLLGGEPLPWDRNYPQPLKEFYRETYEHGLNKRIIVEYERSAFVCRCGNVRITFDRNIAFSARTSEFLRENLPLVPILPTGLHLLEVKYDELIPDYILQLLETGELARTAFSKYYLACLAQKGEYVW